MADESTGVRSGTPTEPTGSQALAARITVVGGALAIGGGVAVTALTGSLPRSLQLLPLAASILILGVPHGAVDHLVLPRARGERVTRGDLAFVGVLYLVVGSLYAAVWFLAPAVAFTIFIGITLAHWGQGDVYTLVELASASHLETRSMRILTALVRGGLPMLVPLIAFPAEYAFVASALIDLFDPAAAAALDPIFATTTRLAVAVGFGTLVVFTLANGFLVADDRGPWVIDAVETLALLAYFAVVPPLLAIGCYFALWHSLRHVVRAMLLDDHARGAVARRDLPVAFGRFARDAAPLTAGAVLVFVALGFSIPATPATLADVMGIYLVGIAVLTLPHVIVVTLLDLEVGLWSP
ncbi:Brp/Blh family beta-carotene 15,15'-dioxygenase [Natronolimnobius baerhuensis]|uniref:Probable beta-carotene 15,15'-dioxygenase n=1 Tax=Natronolimnobius baerhuensis TaxID=253108 RepID=A0A202E8T5_9EURY|nr:Brp/Blh family beta-carotene 15,15'-dioxygenase [Natronolimnobius baerhuensis]OVE84647.1 beta-carotene 15,15'-monooxygenase [Natronolimnobius baerhuensis]